MSWEKKATAVARRSTQTRFVIHTEELEFASPEFIQSLNAEDENEHLAYKDGFAKELLKAIGDNLSISDLKQIIDVFTIEYDKRESKRQIHIKNQSNTQ